MLGFLFMIYFRPHQIKLQCSPLISTVGLSTFSYIDTSHNHGIFSCLSMLKKFSYIDICFWPIRYIDMPACETSINKTKIVDQNTLCFKQTILALTHAFFSLMILDQMSVLSCYMRCLCVT